MGTKQRAVSSFDFFMAPFLFSEPPSLAAPSIALKGIMHPPPVRPIVVAVVAVVADKKTKYFQILQKTEKRGEKTGGRPRKNPGEEGILPQESASGAKTERI
jgi:hypothetical protein